MCCVTQREKERLRLHMKSWFQCNLTNVYVIFGPKWICSIHVQGYEECTVVDFCSLFLCASVEATSTMHCISSYLTVKCVCMNMTEVSNVVYLCMYVYSMSYLTTLLHFHCICLEWACWSHLSIVGDMKKLLCVCIGLLAVCMCIGLWLYVCVLAFGCMYVYWPIDCI